MQLRIHWWERGLRANVRRRCSVDPCTYKEYTDIDKAQSAACACEAHLMDSYVASDDEVPEAKRPRVVQMWRTHRTAVGVTSVDTLAMLLALALDKGSRKTLILRLISLCLQDTRNEW